MDKYRRVDKPRSETSDIKENEIRITTQGKMRNYISYATNLLSDPNKQAGDIVLKAMGRAINKTVTIAEIIKRRVPGLHQNTQIDSTDITDVWEPLEEGLHRLETTRHVSSIQITLSTKPLDPNSSGYQPPIPADQVKPMSADMQERPRGPRGGPRRGRGGRFRGGRGGGRGGGEGGMPLGGQQQPGFPQQQPPGGPIMEGEMEGRPRRGGGRGRGRGRYRGPRGGDMGPRGGDMGEQPQGQIQMQQPPPPFQQQDINNNNQPGEGGRGGYGEGGRGGYGEGGRGGYGEGGRGGYGEGGRGGYRGRGRGGRGGRGRGGRGRGGRGGRGRFGQQEGGGGGPAEQSINA